MCAFIYRHSFRFIRTATPLTHNEWNSYTQRNLLTTLIYTEFEVSYSILCLFCFAFWLFISIDYDYVVWCDGILLYSKLINPDYFHTAVDSGALAHVCSSIRFTSRVATWRPLIHFVNTLWCPNCHKFGRNSMIILAYAEWTWLLHTAHTISSVWSKCVSKLNEQTHLAFNGFFVGQVHSSKVKIKMFAPTTMCTVVFFLLVKLLLYSLKKIRTSNHFDDRFLVILVLLVLRACIAPEIRFGY